jgi:tetratricopeptide (TPR) repeat protein
MDYRLEQFRVELREEPSSRSFFKLGECLRREDELDEAVQTLRAGLEMHPGYIAAWVSLGRALLAGGKSIGAAEALAQALQLDPDNAVAALFAGEAAIANEEWVEAVKNLKRARGLTPQDDTLDERIVFVEGKLAGLGLLEKPKPIAPAKPEPPPVPVETGAVGEPFAVQPAGDTGEWDDANDVFASGWVDDEDVASLTDDDAVESVSEEIAADEVDFEVIDEETPEPEPEPEHEHETEPEDLPLPTMTLARLAVEQGDPDLAEKILYGVLEEDPGNQDAERLLESLNEAVPRPETASGVEDRAAEKVLALQEWLGAVRLAAERLDS